MRNPQSPWYSDFADPFKVSFAWLTGNLEALLFQAIEQHNLHLLHLCIQFGANVNAIKAGLPAIWQAVQCGNIDIIGRLLITPGLNIQVKVGGKDALQAAITQGKVQIAKMFLTYAENTFSSLSDDEVITFLSFFKKVNFKDEEKLLLQLQPLFNSVSQRLSGPDRTLFDLKSYLSKQLNSWENDGFGYITYAGALLTAAQVKQRKKTVFAPTILQTDEFYSYLSLLNQAKKPLREKFVVGDFFHWLCGEISIGQNGAAKMLIISSLKPNPLHFSAQVSAARKIFSNLTVYVNAEEMQHTANSCQTFALDSVQRLYRAQKYLPQPYTELFDYLEQNQTGSIRAGAHKVKLVHLPPSLKITMQSRELFTSLEKYKEEKVVINKKKQTALVVAKKCFVKEDGQLHNNKLLTKLYKMSKDGQQYLAQSKPEEVTQQMKGFTFGELRKRVK